MKLATTVPITNSSFLLTAYLTTLHPHGSCLWSQMLDQAEYNIQDSE